MPRMRQLGAVAPESSREALCNRNQTMPGGERN